MIKLACIELIDVAKRFTDTNKYKKPFIRGLQGAYKVLWDYLYHDCDHAGIWIVDFEVAQIYVGHDLQINKKDALKLFNENEERIIEVDSGKKWFLPSFIEFQYGELNSENRAHKSVINILENKGLIRVLQDRKDMDKDKVLVKDMDKEKEKENDFSEVEIYPTFEDFWNAYDKKKGKDKCKSKFDKLKQDVREKIMNHLFLYKQETPDKQFRKNPETYLNNQSWNDEIIINNNGKQQPGQERYEQASRIMSKIRSTSD